MSSPITMVLDRSTSKLVPYKALYDPASTTIPRQVPSLIKQLGYKEPMIGDTDLIRQLTLGLER